MKSGWWSPRAITLHVALVVALPLFLLLGIWQLRRALHGNVLSWAYTFEWPFFAAYATWMWWKLVHEETAMASTDDTDASPSSGPSVPTPRADWDPYDESDPELAAYNRYLAGLHADRPQH